MSCPAFNAKTELVEMAKENAWAFQAPACIRLSIAHRDQSVSNLFRLVSGLWSDPSARPAATPSRAIAQWLPLRLHLHHRCGGSAGIRPASQFSATVKTGAAPEWHDLIIRRVIPVA